MASDGCKLTDAAGRGHVAIAVDGPAAVKGADGRRKADSAFFAGRGLARHKSRQRIHVSHPGEKAGRVTVAVLFILVALGLDPSEETTR